MFKGIEESPQRISVVLSYKDLDKPQPISLYPPAQHPEMIESLYATLGASHRFETPSRVPDRTGIGPVIHTEVIRPRVVEKFTSGGRVKALSTGSEVSCVSCIRQVAAINLFLDLQDPSTCCTCAEYERLGFFFSGILPRAGVGEALILQYLNNVPLDYSKIQTYTDVAKKLLDYVRTHDPNE